MNTADRSLAMVDYALRRRFMFRDLKPCFSHGRFEKELVRQGVEVQLARAICDRLTAVNEVIMNDPALGTGFVLGHSYFCHHADRYDEVWYRRIVEFELVPFLQELWFDNAAKVEECAGLLRGDA